ncbi:IS66 family transposase [Enterococcus faecium]|uniref:IS66 family transposase n=1 Tax=Enterococcus faecium TaxID=1352 RepID=UPI0039C6D975
MEQTHGLDISRDNITNWHIKAVQNALDPLGERLRVYLNQEEILHGDETSYRVIESAKTDTYYWQFCTGKKTVSIPSFIITTTKVVLEMFEKLFSKEFTGYLHCDGYSGYNAVESVRLVYCFAHVRRKFFRNNSKRKEKTRIFPQLKQSNNWINGLS